jgi:hypothetical protein
LRPRLLLLLLALVALVLAGGAAPATASVPGTALPLLHGVSRVVADDAHGHVFVSGAQSDSVVMVMNESDGSIAKTITGETNVRGMALDGGTLYVARCNTGVIDEIDTATLQSVGTISADLSGSCDLAIAGGRLWYQGTGTLKSISLDSSHTIVTPGTAMSGQMLVSSPGQPDQLVVGRTGVSPATLWVYDVSDPASPSVQATTTFGGGDLNDMTVTPDGGTLLLAQGAPYVISALTLPGLGTPAGVTQYPTGPYPTAVAVSPDGAKVAGGAEAQYDPDVLEFDIGSSTSTHTWDFGSTTDLLYPRGLAFNADGSRLFAVSGNVLFSHTVTFHVLSTLPAGALTVTTSRTKLLFGNAVTVTAHLGTTSSNKVVAIYRQGTRTGSPAKLVTSGRVNAKGNLNVSLKPAADTIYTARWTGDATHKATTTAKSRRVNVRVLMHTKTKGGYATSGGYRLYHYAASCSGASHVGCPTFAGSATPSHPGYTFRLTSQAYLGGRWKTVVTGQGVSNAKGKLVVKIYYTNKAAVGVRQRIRFSLADHSDHLGNHSAWAYFRVT